MQVFLCIYFDFCMSSTESVMEMDKTLLWSNVSRLFIVDQYPIMYAERHCDGEREVPRFR